MTKYSLVIRMKLAAAGNVAPYVDFTHLSLIKLNLGKCLPIRQWYQFIESCGRASELRNVTGLCSPEWAD